MRRELETRNTPEHDDDSVETGTCTAMNSNDEKLGRRMNESTV